VILIAIDVFYFYSRSGGSLIIFEEVNCSDFFNVMTEQEGVVSYLRKMRKD
jgi:hypothetical protein